MRDNNIYTACNIESRESCLVNIFGAIHSGNEAAFALFFSSAL